MSLKTKLTLLRCCLSHIFLWTLTESTTGNLEVFEKWLYRVIINICWKVKITYIIVHRKKAENISIAVTQREMFVEEESSKKPDSCSKILPLFCIGQPYIKSSVGYFVVSFF